MTERGDTSATAKKNDVTLFETPYPPSHFVTLSRARNVLSESGIKLRGERSLATLAPSTDQLKKL